MAQGHLNTLANLQINHKMSMLHGKGFRKCTLKYIKINVKCYVLIQLKMKTY